MNIELLERVRNHILAHPEELDMTFWFGPCGTTACIAARAVAIAAQLSPASIPAEIKCRISSFACTALDISLEQSRTLFHIDGWLNHRRDPAYRDAAQRKDYAAAAQVAAFAIQDFIDFYSESTDLEPARTEFILEYA